MRLPPYLQPATFIKRLNRFTALVEVRGVSAMAHVANSGRLLELFQPGQPVFLARKDDARRKTAYDLVLVRLPGALVSADARLPPLLVREAFLAGRLPDFQDYTLCRSEVAYGASRLDLALSGPGGACLVEAKSVTLVQGGRSLFPDAPTARGTRHLEELANAARAGLRAAVVFVVQRDDAAPFSPNDATDPAFGAALRQAQAAGVLVRAYRCRVQVDEVTLAEPLPAVL